MSERVTVSSRVAAAYAQLANVTARRAELEKQEKQLKEAILEELGYDPDDEKPLPLTAIGPSGDKLFEVRIGTWRGLDQRYLKERHPDIYAECEKTKPTRVIRGGFE